MALRNADSALIAPFIALCNRHDITAILNPLRLDETTLYLAKRLGIGGIHFKDSRTNLLHPLLPLCKRLGLLSIASVHDALLADAALFHYDYITLSPIFYHKGRSPLGIGAFRGIKRLDRVFALGGVDFINMQDLRDVGVVNFAGIGMFKRP